jgi:hypothetical protein
MVPFARIAQGLVTGLGPRAVTDGASGKLMKALAPELSASAAEVDGGMFAALFPAGSAHGANATQGGNFHGVFEASRWVRKAVKSLGPIASPASGNPETGNYQGECRRARLAVYT